jgi:hypothetical protein
MSTIGYRQGEGFVEHIDRDVVLKIRWVRGARRRRSGGGPRGGCARMPAGTHPHLHVVGASNPIAVPYMERLGAGPGENWLI